MEFLTFKTINDATAYADQHGISDKERFMFLVETEPHTIFSSIFEYFYEG